MPIRYAQCSINGSDFKSRESELGSKLCLITLLLFLKGMIAATKKAASAAFCYLCTVCLARTVDNDSFTVCRNQVLLFKHFQNTTNSFT